MNWKLIALGIVILAFWEADQRARAVAATGAASTGSTTASSVPLSTPDGYYLATGAYGLSILVPDGGFTVGSNALQGLRGLKLKPANPAPGPEKATGGDSLHPIDTTEANAISDAYDDDGGDDDDDGMDDDGSDIDLSGLGDDLDGFSDLDVDTFGF
ncbi:MAG TPA: hypothetical protein VHU87_14565 [Rhizomicrobium sp.]|jgi:hypothetical protein|nr:hypothetical protein [Rhizomicrobium sp.]